MDRRASSPSLMSRRQALAALGVLSAAAAGCDLDVRAESVFRLPVLPVAAREIDLDDLPLPDRRLRALSGSRFIDETRSMSWAQREAAVLEQVLEGNVPAFLRRLAPVPVSYEHGGRRHTAELRVTPDYLCIGSDDDFIRMPMNGRTAQRLAVATGCGLPTTKIVDAIYDQAPLKVTSTALPHGADMMSSAYFMAHHRDIEARRRQLGGKLGALCAGHKKDVVISRRLEYQPGQLAIYGWHREDRTAIQYLSTFHEDTYVDYTHGVRLVADEMTVDGEPRKVADVLRDPELCALLSVEGPVRASYAT
jgi:hypothetical protein